MIYIISIERSREQKVKLLDIISNSVITLTETRLRQYMMNNPKQFNNMKIIEKYVDEPKITIYETHSNSMMTLNDSELDRIALSEIPFANMERVGKKLRLKDWARATIKEGKYDSTQDSALILIGKIGADKYKVIARHHKIIANEVEFKTFLNGNRMLNCKYFGPTILSEDTFDITIDIEYEKYIEAEYNKYVAKSALMGQKVSFKYTVEDKEVRLDKYCGESKEIVIPNFITSIGEMAFSNDRMTSIKLNNGLTHIGAGAFDKCNLSNIVIPETVVFVGKDAFKGNKNLLDKTRVLRMNSSTLVL